MVQYTRLALLVLTMFFLDACGPDTIFLRPALDTPVQHVKNGHRLLMQGKIDAANIEFTRAQNLDADYAPAYVGIALVQGHRGDVDGGFETLAKVRNMALTADEIKEVERARQLLQAMKSAQQE